ncbi:pre-toxin TG domain-containing protein [Peribacillus frigoritolerans]
MSNTFFPKINRKNIKLSLENRPWYEKAWDTTKTFTGEFTGYYDSIRASTGVDPVTGRKLSDAERIAAGAMAAAGFIPVVGRAIKGGSALYKTAKGLNAADHALDAYKTTKDFSLLQKTEYGIYGLLAANGLGEAVTGKDMFGNQLTEEQRPNGLLMALGIGGVAGAAKVADKVASGTKFVPYSKEFAQKQVQKVQAFGREIGKVKVPLRIRVEELATAYGNNYKHVTFDNTTVKDIVQKFAVKSDGGKGVNYQKFMVKDSNVEGVSGKNITNGIDNVNLKNIDEFIAGTKTFEDVINDFAKLYSEKILTNKTWSWNKSFHGGEYLTARQRKLIKEKAIENGVIPNVNVIKVEGMRYGFADFKTAGVVVEIKELPERLWLSSDDEQFDWLDNAIGGRPEGMTWHHTEIPGKMELVPFKIHNITIHNGGRSTGMWADAPR